MLEEGIQINESVLARRITTLLMSRLTGAYKAGYRPTVYLSVWASAPVSCVVRHSCANAERACVT